MHNINKLKILATQFTFTEKILLLAPHIVYISAIIFIFKTTYLYAAYTATTLYICFWIYMIYGISSLELLSRYCGLLFRMTDSSTAEDRLHILDFHLSKTWGLLSQLEKHL